MFIWIREKERVRRVSIMIFMLEHGKGATGKQARFALRGCPRWWPGGGASGCAVVMLEMDADETRRKVIFAGDLGR